jgi:hypothetical protein
VLHGLRYFGHGAVKGGLVGLRWFLEATDFAHKLQGGSLNLVVTGRRVKMIERFDVAAHRFSYPRLQAKGGTIFMQSTPSETQPSDLPKTSQPAWRALTGAGYWRLEQLTQVSEAELLRLHGMGPKAISVLAAALAERGLAFAPPDHK